MHHQLVSLWTSKVSMPSIIEKLERPTVKARAVALQKLITQSWWMAFAFCNDKRDGEQPHRDFIKTTLAVQEYAKEHNVTIEDAWTMTDPLPN